MEQQKLDKERPFGIVIGDPKVGFEQDGLHFSHEEKFVTRWASAEQLQNERVIREKQAAKEHKLAVRRAQAEIKRKLLEDE